MAGRGKHNPRPVSNEMEEVFYNAINIAFKSDFRKIWGLKQKHKTWRAAWRGLSGKKDVDPEKEWQRLSKTRAVLILKENTLYPLLLKEIYDPPFGIYVSGKLPEKRGLFLAIVGTRKATIEGARTAKDFGKSVAEKGAVVISGLALGVDAAAHAGCLEAGGKTVAVLGCGIDNFYPHTNEKLAKDILASGGAIISEYPIGAPPLPYRFLERNRVVAGLSRGVLVVEAPDRSGSLVTARLAMEQNRDVFVIPGPINHPNYRGSNQLIRQGAELITRPEEILETYGLVNEKGREIAAIDSEEEKIIFEALEGLSSPVSVDKICELTDLKATVINRALTSMIIKNIVAEISGSYTIK